MRFIELFAGCGGMSLGLEAAGFKLFFANELSPMAAETYAFNLLNEDLQKNRNNESVLWIQSQYKKEDLRRLRENPSIASKGKISDLNNNTDLQHKLLVGDINQLLEAVKSNSKILKSIKDKRIEVMAGGPPCQSFSLAGRREKNNSRNQLPWAFAEFANLVKPKFILLENVSGILRPFTESGEKYYAWFEVAKAFAINDYIPVCMHINAKYFGLPQNRPRFIMLGIMANLYHQLKKDDIIDSSHNFLLKVRSSKGTLKITDYPEYKFYELNGEKDVSYFERSLYLPTPTHINKKNHFVSVSYGIRALEKYKSDIDPRKLKNDPYFEELNKIFGNLNPRPDYIIKNQNLRSHSEKIKNRFKFLKLISAFPNGDKSKLIHALKVGTTAYLDARLMNEVIKRFGQINNSDDLEAFFSEYKSRKHTQRALVKDRPAPATLSIPDDVCHYRTGLDRTLTVREMARIQSFPDWFEFRSKDTTGGKNRRFEVPNYTQVGNAVPPLLAKELGEWIETILKKLD